MALRIAVPNKGRLRDDAIDILRRVGIRAPRTVDRSLMVAANGGRYQVLYSRAQDIPEFVQLGAADIGITGLDIIEEEGAKVERLLDLGFGYCKLVVAAPENEPMTPPSNSTVSASYNSTRDPGAVVSAATLRGCSPVSQNMSAAECDIWERPYPPPATAGSAHVDESGGMNISPIV